MNEAVDVTRLDYPREGIPELTHEDIDEAVARLAAGTGPFSIDTERAMGIRYSDRAYLVQIRREKAGTFLIDPVGIEDRLGPLAEVLRQDEWILHAADQDLPCLRELGLEPRTIYDTEIAGLLLGFERVSLQAEIAEVLGYGLAKEHSFSDWSARPLGPELRSYAALDVELLLELAVALDELLEHAGRLEWLAEECEEVRLREPKVRTEEPWRKDARVARIRDRRALGMLAALWDMRDSIARSRDIAVGRVLPGKVLAQLAASKPRSRQDVLNSPLLRTRTRKRDAPKYWEAISKVWEADANDLPERFVKKPRAPFPPVQRWKSSHPEEAARWAVVRSSVFQRADELGIRQDILLKPAHQKQLAWEGWTAPSDIPALLAKLGARPWQVENVAPQIEAAVRRAL